MAMVGVNGGNFCGDDMQPHFLSLANEAHQFSPGLPTPPGTTLIPNFFSGAIRCKHRADQPSTVPDRGNIHLF